MNIQSAIRFIESHGHKAFTTPEGLTAVCHATRVNPIAADDSAFEIVETFPVYAGMLASVADQSQVSLSAIRDWLGY